MDLKEKFEKIFNSGHSFTFQNKVTRIDGEWEDIIVWEHVQLPLSNYLASCDIETDDIEECVDDCLEYIKTLK